MKLSNLMILVLVLVAGATAAFATPTDLSARITGSRPWTGGCATLGQGNMDYLPHDVLNCQVQFSCGWVSGFLRKNELVEFEVESTTPEGQWRRITRTMRCGNPARGRYFVPTPKPVVVTRVVERPVLVPVDPVVQTQVVERQVPVEVVRTETKYIDRTVCMPARQYIPPPGITPLMTPALAVNPGSTSVGPWQTLVTGAVALVPDPPKVCRDGEEPRPPDCGPGEPPVQPTPGDAGGPGNGGIDNGLGDPGGYTPPPAVPPGYGDGGNAAPPSAGPPTPPVGGTGPAIPDPGTSPVTPAWGGNAAPAP